MKLVAALGALAIGFGLFYVAGTIGYPPGMSLIAIALFLYVIVVTLVRAFRGKI